MAKKSSGLMLWLGVATVAVLLDQLSKITMSRLLSYGQSETITSYFNLVMVYNQGAAFSFLSNQGGWQRWFFSALALGVSVFIVFMLKKNASQRMFCWSLSLILGGAVGNLIDRIAYGHVIDFLDFHIGRWHWPAFNVADGAITIGAALFVLDELRRVNR
jgi:signal peptidase II